MLSKELSFLKCIVMLRTRPCSRLILHKPYIVSDTKRDTRPSNLKKWLHFTTPCPYPCYINILKGLVASNPL